MSIKSCNIALMNRSFRSFYALTTIALFTLIGYSACIKNKCVGVLCVNNGVCVEGVCTCPYGYEGADCGTEWVHKFLREWKATDAFINDTSGRFLTYDIIIEGSKDSFYVSGLLDSLGPVKCKVTSRFVFTMAEQVMDSNITIKTGKGSLDSNTQTITGLITVRLQDTVLREREAGLGLDGRALKNLVPVKRDTIMTTRFSWKR